MSRILVLANDVVLDARHDIPEPVRSLLPQAEEILVVCPAQPSRLQWIASDVDGPRRDAQARLDHTLADMRRGGMDPRGEVGDEHQLTALHDALAGFDADAIVVTCRDRGAAVWSERDVARRVRQDVGVPVHVLQVERGGRVLATT